MREQDTPGTPQHAMHKALVKSGIPAKEIKVYGSQIMITAWSEDAARKWFRLLQQFASTVRQPKKSIDYNKENRGTCLMPTVHDVWLVWATV